MQKWQYATAMMTWKMMSGWKADIAGHGSVKGYAAILDVYGSQGWELVTIVSGSQSNWEHWATFKRPLD